MQARSTPSPALCQVLLRLRGNGGGGGERPAHAEPPRACPQGLRGAKDARGGRRRGTSAAAAADPRGRARWALALGNRSRRRRIAAVGFPAARGGATAIARRAAGGLRAAARRATGVDPTLIGLESQRRPEMTQSLEPLVELVPGARLRLLGDLGGRVQAGDGGLHPADRRDPAFLWVKWRESRQEAHGVTLTPLQRERGAEAGALS